MLKTMFTRIFAAALLLGLAQIASAQTADEIVEKHLAALGGRAPLEKLKTRSVKGTITVSSPVVRN